MPIEGAVRTFRMAHTMHTAQWFAGHDKIRPISEQVVLQKITSCKNDNLFEQDRIKIGFICASLYRQKVTIQALKRTIL